MTAAPPPSERGPAELTFSFQFALLSALVEVKGDTLIGKMSTRTVVVPLPALRAFYAPRPPHSPHRELVLAYEVGGRLRRARLFADAGASGFEALVSYLRARSPALDLSHLGPQEAYEALGCRDAPWVVAPLLMLGGVLLLALLASPLLIHGLDRGEARLEAAALSLSAEALNARLHALPSRNLIIDGARLDVTRASLSHSDGRMSLLAPVVPARAEGPAEPPVHAIALFAGRALDLDALGARREVRGVWRGVGWEGLSERQLARLREAGVALTPPVVFIELDAEPRDDLTVYVSLLAVSLGLTLVVWRALSARRPPSAPRRLS
jgi:hypothetical protein